MRSTPSAPRSRGLTQPRAPHPDASAYARQFSGKYEHRFITGGIGHNPPQGALSLVACAPGAQGTRFVRDLMQVATYASDGEHLVLTLRSDSGTMVFSPMPPASLTGTTWRVTEINNGQDGVVPVLPGTQVTASFGADGTISGETGCNIYRASCTIAGSTIGFGPTITTRRACLSDAARAQEQAFLAAVSASSTYELAGDRLTLRDAAGATQISLVRPTLEPPR